MRILKVLIALTIYVSSYAQMLTVSTAGNNNNPFWLAENILVDSNFVIFSPLDPVTFLPIVQPSTNQVGYFKVNNNTGVNAFPISEGIVMSTDFVPDVLPSTTGGKAQVQKIPKDPDLAAVWAQVGTVATTDMMDFIEIQFAFIATSDSIRFNYVFGSHEYSNYTCTQFNDVFGFFMTGVGINGNPASSTVNLATVPNTTVPVAINTINGGAPTGGGQHATCLAANPNYVAHSVYFAGNSPLTSLNGVTEKFTAKAQVVCGQAYVIKLKLANASDGAFDSAVFLEANSFSSPTIVVDNTLNSGNTFLDSQVVEGCKPSYISFKKNGNKNVDMTLRFNYSGNAIPGVDFATMPDSLFIPSGQISDSLEVLVFDDGIVEPNDSIIVDMQSLVTNCAAYPGQRKIIYLRDKTPVATSSVNVTGTDSIYCPGDTVRFNASYTGGEGNLYGWWEDDTLAPLNRLVQPAQTTTYYFHATDECGSDTATDSVTVYLVDYVPINTTGDTIRICRGDTVGMLARYEDGKAPYDVIWDDGTLGDYKVDVPVVDTTWHTFIVTDACGQIAYDSVLVWMAPDPSAGFNFVNDPGVPLKVNFTNTSINGVQYTWDFGDGTTSNDTTPSHVYDNPSEYMVTLTIASAEGCIDTYTTIVKVETDFYLYVPTAFTPDGDGINEFFEVKGLGFEEYEIHIFNRWGGEVFYSDDISISWDGTAKGNPAPGGVYTYTIFIKMPLGDFDEKKGTFMLYR